MPPSPIYTFDNCNFAFQLDWGLTLFWRSPIGSDDWMSELCSSTEPDGIRILSHRFIDSATSQFLVSTRPITRPSSITKCIKGRLQHLVRKSRRTAFRRNYDLVSLGSTKLEKVEEYVAGQLRHHTSNGVQHSSDLVDSQFIDLEVNLSKPRFAAHGRFCCNLHLVFVRANRDQYINRDQLLAIRQMIRTASVKKKHLLSRLGILHDHMHMTLGIGVIDSPGEMALAYMNNIAYACGMSDILMHSCYIGGVGAYDLGAVRGSAKTV